MRILWILKLDTATQMPSENNRVQQLPQNREFCQSMPQQNRKHKKKKSELPRRNQLRRERSVMLRSTKRTIFQLSQNKQNVQRPNDILVAEYAGSLREKVKNCAHPD